LNHAAPGNGAPPGKHGLPAHRIQAAIHLGSPLLTLNYDFWARLLKHEKARFLTII